MSDESRAAARPEKSAAAFRTISEVSEELDVPQHVLRFWETKFSQVKPMKRAGGRRYYRPEDIALLRRIRDLLYAEGYTIRGVQKLLRERGVKGVIAEAGTAGTDGAANDDPGANAPASAEVAGTGAPETGHPAETGDMLAAASGDTTVSGAGTDRTGEERAAEDGGGALPPQVQAELRALRQELVDIRSMLAG